MKKSDDLFQLVKSLQKSEKRQIKLYAAQQSGAKTSNHILLFDAIDRQESYDEEAIARRFQRHDFVKHLPALKKYLFDFVVKCLKMQQTDSAQAYSVYDEFKVIQLLANRGLHQRALKHYEKIKDLFQKIEFYGGLVDLNLVAKDLWNAFYPARVAQAETGALLRENQAFIEMQYLQNSYGIRLLDARMLVSQTWPIRRESERGAFEKMLADPLMANEPETGSRSIHFARLETQMYIFYGLGNLERLAETATATLARLETHPQDCPITVLSVLTTCSFLLHASLKQHDFDEFRRVFHYYRDHLDAHGDKIGAFNKTQLNFIVQRMWLEYNNENGLEGAYFSQAHERELRDFVDENAPALQPELQGQIAFRTAHYFFLKRQYDKALDWLGRVIDGGDGLESSPSIEGHARLMQLLIHFDMGNKQLLESLERSTGRFLKKHDRLFRSEAAVLNHVRAYLSRPLLEQKKNYGGLFAELGGIWQADGLEKNFLASLDLEKWARVNGLCERAMEAEKPFFQINPTHFMGWNYERQPLRGQVGK